MEWAYGASKSEGIKTLGEYVGNRLKDDPDAWSQSDLADEVAFTISPAGRLRREDREVALALEITRLRAGIQAMLDGDYPHPRAYRSEPGMRCPHGTLYHDNCEQCNDEWLAGLLDGSKP